MIAEWALSAVAALLILQSLFWLRVATKNSEESAEISRPTQVKKIALADSARSDAPDSSTLRSSNAS